MIAQTEQDHRQLVNSARLEILAPPIPGRGAYYELAIRIQSGDRINGFPKDQEEADGAGFKNTTLLWGTGFDDNGVLVHQLHLRSFNPDVLERFGIQYFQLPPGVIGLP